MRHLPIAFVMNPQAARNARFGCMPCRWKSGYGVEGIAETLEHAAGHELEPNGDVFRQGAELIRKAIREDQVDMILDGCVMSKRGEDGWNSDALYSLEAKGVLIRIRGMG